MGMKIQTNCHTIDEQFGESAVNGEKASAGLGVSEGVLDVDSASENS